MNVIDIYFGLFLLLTALFGLYKGFVASIIHLAALILAFILVSEISPMIAFLLITKLNFSELLAAILSYVIVFVSIVFLAKLTIYFLHKVIKILKISFINRILGFIFGLVNGLVILSFLILLVNISPFEKKFSHWSKDSQLITSLQKWIDKLTANVPELKQQQKDGIDQLIENHLKKKA
jgi:membrane protein required for colicin V production